MAIAGFLDRMCLALWASGLWLRYATLQNLIPFFPWIAPHALHPGAIQGKEGIKFCSVAQRSHSPEARRAKHIRSKNPAIAIWQSWICMVNRQPLSNQGTHHLLSGNRRELPVASPSPGCHRRPRTEAGSGPQGIQPSQEVADEAQHPRLNLRLDDCAELVSESAHVLCIFLMFAALDINLC